MRNRRLLTAVAAASLSMSTLWVSGSLRANELTSNTLQGAGAGPVQEFAVNASEQHLDSMVGAIEASLTQRGFKRLSFDNLGVKVRTTATFAHPTGTYVVVTPFAQCTTVAIQFKGAQKYSDKALVQARDLRNELVESLLASNSSFRLMGDGRSACEKVL